MNPQEPTAEQPQTMPIRWLVATRPGFLGAAVIPVLLGLAVAGRVSPPDGTLAVLTLLGAVLAHAGINVLNDVFDHRSGADPNNTTRIFPYTGGSRMIQNGVLTERSMLYLGSVLLLAAALIGLLLLPAGGPVLLAIGAAGLLLGWAYSAPPLKLASRGLGELTVGLGFGGLIPAGTAWVQAQALPSSLWPAGATYGLLVMLILVINQFPDHDADLAAGKRNLVVRLGRRRGGTLYLGCLLAAAATAVTGVLVSLLPVISLLALLPMAWHAQAWRALRLHGEQPGALREALRMTLRGSMLAGLVLVVSLLQG